MSGPSALCPENSTSAELLPVAAANAMASPAIASPATGEGGEPPGRGHRGPGSGRRIPLYQADGADAETAAERDQRCLGSEHHAEAQGRERREQAAGQFDRHRSAFARLEPVGW